MCERRVDVWVMLSAIPTWEQSKKPLKFTVCPQFTSADCASYAERMIKQMKCMKIISTTTVLSIVGVVKVVQDACALVAYALISYGKWEAVEAAHAAPAVVFALTTGLLISFWISFPAND